MKFSDRIGATTPSNVLLLDSITPALRNSLWNYLLRTLFRRVGFYESSNARYNAVAIIAERFFRRPVDALPDDADDCQDWLRDWFFDDKTPWYELYNLIQFIVINAGDIRVYSAEMIPAINQILTEELSGYRFINGELVPISSEHEMAAINDAMEKARSTGLPGVLTHLQTAVALMSKKPDPDYRNSIKESISAVESLAKQITGEKSGGLEKALTKLDAQVKFHGAFKAGLLSLYGYTSGKDGIRHALLEESSVGLDEAKFMLVSCSALINFMVAKAATAGLLPTE